MSDCIWQDKQVKIFQVLSGRSNAWLVVADNEVILVDTGKAAAWNKLVRNIKRTGIDLHQLTYLFLTHTHFDHCQSAARLRDQTDCKIIVSKKAINSISNGYTVLPDGTFLVTKFIAALGRKIGKRRFGYARFKPDSVVDGDSTFGFSSSDFKVIETPGHSIDSISLIINQEVAIVGDALFGVFPKSIFPPYADDVAAMVRSWGKLLETGCPLFLPGHGRLVSRNLLQKEFKKYSG